MSLQVGRSPKRIQQNEATPYSPFGELGMLKLSAQAMPTSRYSAFAPSGTLLEEPSLAASMDMLENPPIAEEAIMPETSKLFTPPLDNPYRTDALSVALGNNFDPNWRGTGPSRLYRDNYQQPDAKSRIAHFKLLQHNAEIAAAETGLPLKVIMAQQIQENGWDKKVLTGKNNYFNIKADKSWKGPKSLHTVKEIINGKEVHVKDWFRDYKDKDQSARDYGKFLKTNKRYNGLFGNGLTPEQMAIELQRSGYATDPNYANGMIGIMNGRTYQQISNSIAKGL